MTTGQIVFSYIRNITIFTPRINTISEYPVAISRSYILSACSLKMPSSSNVLHAVKDIPFPKVPLEVLQLDLVEEQVAEMQEWFRAFANQNDSIRDYRPYFKPILCYMEGAWVYPDLVELDSSPSSRHSIETEDWYDLQEKIRLDHP